MTLDTVRTVIAEAEHADGTPPVSDQALLAAEQGRRTVIAEDDAVGIIGEGELDLVVRPSARRRGLGRVTLDALLRLPEASGELRAWSHGENPAAETLLRGAEFTPIRTLYRLALDPARLPDAIAEARPLPAGYSVTNFADASRSSVDMTGSSDAAHDLSNEWLSVNAAAFAEHPEQGSITADDFAALRAENWFDPEDLLLAVDDASGRLAGYAWIKSIPGDIPETELYVLGVDPQYAGRGLGAALFGVSLSRMQERHPKRITLYVDADNTHATALYQRAGFEIDERSTQWLRHARA